MSRTLVPSKRVSAKVVPAVPATPVEVPYSGIARLASVTPRGRGSFGSPSTPKTTLTDAGTYRAMSERSR